MPFDCLIVGAGFSGATIARVLADAGKSVHILEKRDHIGGNAFDENDDHGVLIHRYGPHIFHTGSTPVFEFLSRFTEWTPYEHKVLARIEDTHYPMPLNRTSLEQFFDVELPTDDDAEQLLASKREPISPVVTSEDSVVSRLGRELYEAFFRPYTKKQWRRDPSELDAAVCARIPVRTNRDDRYFSDKHQAMPKEGYTKLFTKMLDHPNISVETGIEYQKDQHRHLGDILVWTGPIDLYFDYCHGPLPYRSLQFKHEHHAATDDFQPAAVVNYPEEQHEFTRITEFTKLTGQKHKGTSIVYEYPPQEDGGDPYYPVATDAAKEQADKYRLMTASETDVHFIGRLAQYRYFNMDQAVASALKAAEAILKKAETQA